jgi:hypothetical protein
MAQHLLVKYATRRPYREVPDMPEGAIYDSKAGCWFLHGKPLIVSKEYAGGRPATKKNDQETGEDMKGE